MIEPVSSTVPFEPVQGIYCDICTETWHERYAHRSADGDWHVPSSEIGGAYYLVVSWGDGTWGCGCAGYHYRGDCKHARQVAALEEAGRKHSLPHVVWVRYEQYRWPPDVTVDEL